ncbi:hypothetical protein H671_1g0626 [Cricetulus griseus]|nr:hypothetical protein H671_1g0626 [Cricetulus griseus]
MAEGRRREDEEEELRERRELGGPRRARGRALPGHSAAEMERKSESRRGFGKTLGSGESDNELPFYWVLEYFENYKKNK